MHPWSKYGNMRIIWLNINSEPCILQFLRRQHPLTAPRSIIAPILRHVTETMTWTNNNKHVYICRRFLNPTCIVSVTPYTGTASYPRAEGGACRAAAQGGRRAKTGPPREHSGGGGILRSGMGSFEVLFEHSSFHHIYDTLRPYYCNVRCGACTNLRCRRPTGTRLTNRISSQPVMPKSSH